MSMMHSSAMIHAGGILADLLGGTISANVVSGTATALYQVNSDGKEYRQVNGGSFAELNQWLKAGAAGDYEIRMTMDSGTNFSGAALNTWLAASTSRSWFLSHSGSGGGINGTGTIEVRRTSTGDVLDSASVTLAATVTG